MLREGRRESSYKYTYAKGWKEWVIPNRSNVTSNNNWDILLPAVWRCVSYQHRNRLFRSVFMTSVHQRWYRSKRFRCEQPDSKMAAVQPFLPAILPRFEDFGSEPRAFRRPATTWRKSKQSQLPPPTYCFALVFPPLQLS